MKDRLKPVRYDTKCRVCYSPITIGVMAWMHRPGPRMRWRVTCQECNAKASLESGITTSETPLAREHAYPGASSVETSSHGIVVAYPDIDTFQHDARRDTHVYNASNSDAHGLQDDSRLSSWYGVSSVREAYLLADEGWIEGLDKIRTALPNTLAPKVRSSQRRARWTDDGDDFDRERYQSGKEDYYRVAKREAGASGRTVTTRLLVRVGANGGARASDWLWTGAAAMVWADALEESGIRVRIDIVATSHHTHMTYQHSTYVVTLKDYHQPLAPERLAFWTAHPASFRVFGFRWRLSGARANNGLGHSTDPHESVINAEPGTVFVPRLEGEYSARQWLRLVSAGLCDPAA